MKKISRYFIQGLIMVAPIAITIYSIKLLINLIDSFFIKYIVQIVGFKIPGLSLIILVLLITLIGVLGSSFVFKPILKYADKLISQTPLIKIIYTSIKDFMNAFVGKDKKFTEPVSVKIYNNSNIEKLGFITQRDLSQLGMAEDKIAVYFPHSYNFSGNLFIVSSSMVTPLNIAPAEVMKFIVTAGVTNIEDSNNNTKTN